MQHSTALKLHQNKLSVSPEENKTKQKPQFGQRANPAVKPVVPQVQSAVEQHVVVEKIIHFKSPALPFVPETQEPLRSFAPDYSAQRASTPKLLREIFRDFAKNAVAYALILAVSVTCVIKVHQVQRTRDLTIQYNEIKGYNDTLMREQLNLLATRENYTEYSVIRKRAVDSLGMIAVKTEEETVIDLR